MCTMLSFSMIAGCGQSGSSSTGTVREDEDEDEDEDEEEEEERSSREEEEPEEVTPSEADPEPVTDPEPAEEAMPRSDAYDMFLAGDMNVEVINPETDTGYNPATGSYSYDELVETLVGETPGSYVVKYALFTPESCAEGEDILAIYVENQDPSFYSWIGFIAYVDGKLQMKYHEHFGYRSFFEPYFDGYVLYGGSGGAGAHYVNCNMIMGDSSPYAVYKSAVLDSSWCDEASYFIDPYMEYEDRPHLTPESSLHMTVVDDMGMFVKISVSGWSSNTAIREEEEAFVTALEALGAKIVEESETNLDNVVTINEDHAMTWNEIETVTVD